MSSSWLPAVIFAAGGFFSLQMEKLVRSGRPRQRRPYPSILLHSGLFLICLAAVLAPSGRTLFSLLLVLSGQLLVIQVSNAKYRALREPFIFSDFGIFSQAIKHPRLYLPFLGIARALIAAFAAISAILIGWLLEKPMSTAPEWTVAATLCGIAFTVAGLSLSPLPLLQPAADVSRFGLFSSVAKYWAMERNHEPSRHLNLPSISKASHPLPDLVIVQSESFFDPRPLSPWIRPEVLTHFDQACANATLHGKLSVPSWGANTMRSEFSFLTGIAPQTMGIHQFNPYRRATRLPLRALPQVFREAGYKTTCIHPHSARFFRRDRAFPNLGFDRFIDSREFADGKRVGPYISDESVTDKLLDVLSATAGPAFLFVITMENHGPLHLERVEQQQMESLYSDTLPQACGDLGVYLRHLKNADRQLGRLREALHSRNRPFVLVFYGEHLPSMPDVYEELGFPDGRTEYFIETPCKAARSRTDLAIEDLPHRIIKIFEPAKRSGS